MRCAITLAAAVVAILVAGAAAQLDSATTINQVPNATLTAVGPPRTDADRKDVEVAETGDAPPQNPSAEDEFDDMASNDTTLLTPQEEIMKVEVQKTVKNKNVSDDDIESLLDDVASDSNASDSRIRSALDRWQGQVDRESEETLNEVRRSEEDEKRKKRLDAMRQSIKKSKCAGKALAIKEKVQVLNSEAEQQCASLLSELEAAKATAITLFESSRKATKLAADSAKRGSTSPDVAAQLEWSDASISTLKCHLKYFHFIQAVHAKACDFEKALKRKMPLLLSRAAACKNVSLPKMPAVNSTRIVLLHLTSERAQAKLGIAAERAGNIMKAAREQNAESGSGPKVDDIIVKAEVEDEESDMEKPAVKGGPGSLPFELLFSHVTGRPLQPVKPAKDMSAEAALRRETKKIMDDGIDKCLGGDCSLGRR